MTVPKLYKSTTGICTKCHKIKFLGRLKATVCDACYKEVKQDRALPSSWRGTLNLGKRLTTAQRSLASRDVGVEPLSIRGIRL